MQRAYTEINPLTGLYFNKAFFRKANEYIQREENSAYLMAAIDIEHFRLFNTLYGRKEGDRFLVYIAECLLQVQREGKGIAGYLGGDNFCVILSSHHRILPRIQREITEKVEEWSRSVAFLPAFGIYYIMDKTMPAVAMYDCATMALSRVYGNYSQRSCVFSNQMIRQTEEEILLINEIKEGIEREEFVFYVQPQCRISSDKLKIVGGECLVRWNHPKRGIISPGEFVPILEQSGFLAELDRYTWRKACQWLSSWIGRGKSIVPISINVSRIDILSMDVLGYLKGLIEEYKVPPQLLQLEITESVYADENKAILETLELLQQAGFMVIMDDFGSGYSSLNMLKSVTVDALKIDMKFLQFDKNQEERGLNILGSVIRMSQGIGLPTIMEGVENRAQQEFLESMGCCYVQGFYYFRPMPVQDFEKLISDENVLDQGGFQ